MPCTRAFIRHVIQPVFARWQYSRNLMRQIYGVSRGDDLVIDDPDWFSAFGFRDHRFNEIASFPLAACTAIKAAGSDNEVLFAHRFHQKFSRKLRIGIHAQWKGSGS